jgi:hypothetical protein
MKKAYPVYTVPNLQLTRRDGMHRYNKQDHSMLTAILAARNILAGRIQYDLWRVNVDADYHEAGAGSSKDLAAIETSQPLVPRKL